MVIIGELINSTRKKIKEAMQNKDAEFIKTLAVKQDEAGADFIDVNAGAFVTDELEKLEWAINVVQDVTKKTSLDRQPPRRGNGNGFETP